jgi:hypothetical protein
MFTHQTTQGYNDGVTPKSVTTPFTGQTTDGFDGVINAGASDVPIAIGWLNASVQCLMLTSDQALTILTNSTTAPGANPGLGREPDAALRGWHGLEQPVHG